MPRTKRPERRAITVRMPDSMMARLAAEAGRLTAQHGRPVSVNAVIGACLEAQIARQERTFAVQPVAPTRVGGR